MPHRIPTHRSPGQAVASAAGRARYERTPTRRGDIGFYQSPAWRSLRRLYLAEHPLCADCRAAGRLVPAEQVHHVVERKRAPELALDWDNLEGLCVACHNRKRKGTCSSED